MSRIDHHIHTSWHSPDSQIDPFELVRRAREIGLDGVVITEHDYQWEPDELETLHARAGGLVVLSGVEVSAREGHFLVYGLPHLEQVEPGIPLSELLEVVRGHGAAIVAAHPFRWGQDFDEIADRHGTGLDAVELVSNNVTPETRSETQRLVRRTGLGATGSSDAHQVDVVGCYFSEFPGRIDTAAGFVEALRARRGRPRHLPGARLASGPVD